MWYLELSVEKVSAVTAGCVDVWYDICVLLGCQSVNGDGTHHFRGGEHVTIQEATLRTLRIHCVVKMCQRRERRRNKVRKYEKKART